MMNAATVTIVGRAGTNPQVSLGSTGDRASFRVVSTDRRFDKASDSWVDGDECWLTVVCWRALAKAVVSTVRRGDPVVVIGKITNRTFEKNGVTQYFTDIRADFVGLDAARIGSRFTRNFADSTGDAAASPTESEPTGEDSAPPAAGEWQATHDDGGASWEDERTASQEEVLSPVN
jgi:single-strand DNA-binding protein